MVSDYRAIFPQDSPHIPPTSGYCLFIEQVRSGNSVKPEELGLNQPQPFLSYQQQQQIPHSNPYPYHHHSPYAHGHDMHAAIQREIEKEKIREEIIMSEIIRRRELEAEVRRELMMERDLVLRRGNHGVSYGAPSVMELDLPLKPLEERIVPSLMDKERLDGRCVSEPLPFQRGSADVRNSEVIPVTVVPKEKEKIILGAKQNENTCGTKREASKVDALESPSSCKARKKAKEEWNCALCKVTSTSEHALNEHLKGKKHKAKEAALKGGKKFSIGLLSKKAVMAVTVDPDTVYRAEVSLDKTKNDADKLIKKEAAMAAAFDPAAVYRAKVSLDKTKNDADKLNKKEAGVVATVYRAKVLLDKTKNDADKLNKKEAGVAATIDPATFYRAKVSLGKAKNDADNLNKKEAAMAPTVYRVKASLDKTKDDADKLNKKEKCKFWCDLCQVGAVSQNVFNSHQEGKKHKRQLYLSNKNCGDEKLAEGNEIKLGDESTKANVVGKL